VRHETHGARDGCRHKMARAGDGSTQLEAVGSRQWGLGHGVKYSSAQDSTGLMTHVEGWLEIA